MGTRGADKQNRDMLGSVTAEVLDTCRSSVLTIPDTLRFKGAEDINQIVFLARPRSNRTYSLLTRSIAFCPNHRLR